MPVTFGGQPCVDAGKAFQFCQSQYLPTDFAGKANKFVTQLGQMPGLGFFLLSRGSLNQLNLNALSDAVFADGNGGQVTVKDLVVIHRPINVTPGILGDTSACYFLKVADVRWLAENSYYAPVTNQCFNVRVPASGQTYYDSSVFSQGANTPFTWQQMLDKLWGTIAAAVPELGAASPVLPFTPDGTPENFRFHQASAWAAYNMVLRRLGCAFKLDPTKTSAARSSIVRLAVPDQVFTAAESTYASVRNYDTEPLSYVRGKIPASVNVVFQRFDLHYGTEQTTTPTTSQWSMTPTYSINVPDPNHTAGEEAGSAATLFDDLSALFNFDGTINNQSALQSRATERANDFYRMLTVGSRHRVYVGIINDPGFLMGPQLYGVAWYDLGGGRKDGHKTEIIRNHAHFRVDKDSGEWEEMWEETNDRLRPPDLGRASYPNYPAAKTNPVSIAGAAQTANIYDALVQRPNPTSLGANNAESCWAWSISGVALTAGNVCSGILWGTRSDTTSPGGQPQQRPLYLVWPIATPAASLPFPAVVKVNGTIFTTAQDGILYDAVVEYLNPNTAGGQQPFHWEDRAACWLFAFTKTQGNVFAPLIVGDRYGSIDTGQTAACQLVSGGGVFSRELFIALGPWVNKVICSPLQVTTY